MHDFTGWTTADLEARNNALGLTQNTLRARRAALIAEAEVAFEAERAPIRAERAAIAEELARRSGPTA